MNALNVKSDLERAQERMLLMLVFIDKICTENSIDYWLDWGTLLGAVRHKGFIPWDDDSDICMTRKSFKQFKKAIKNYSSDFVVQDHSTDKNYFSFIATLRDTKSEYIQNSNEHRIRKFRGLQTDIFIVEDRLIPYFDRITTLFSLKTHQLLMENPGRVNLWKVNVFFYFRILILHPFFRIFKNFKKDRDTLSICYGGLIKSIRYKSEIYPIMRMEFEGLELNVPGSFDKYLKRLYGDYMEIPKVEDRVTHNVQIKFYD